MKPLEETFIFKDVEKKLWDFWEKEDFFSSHVDDTKVPYSVLMPPPNVTSKLHMGHGLNGTIQDILIRYKRMLGQNAMWLPGTDHAGIATQMMVEKSLEKKGIKKKDLGRKAFFHECEKWKEENGSQIIDQLKKMGFSCDWKRLSYTMDEKLSYAVRAIFVKLFEDGLIYRGERLVNWDPVLQTAVSDDEMENVEETGHLYHIRYFFKGSDTEFLTVATTRPETLFGDTAVCVHPDDESKKHLVGKQIEIPLTGRSVPVIADSFVKKEFGSGCVKITPAHDFNDFEVGKRANLPFLMIFSDDATLNESVPEGYRGLDRFVARKKLVKELEEKGFLEKIEKHKMVLPYSQRGKCVIEPKLSKQWFVNMKDLAQYGLSSVKNREVVFYPESWTKTYDHWLENIKDWCISRQLWWGHQIPIWYCLDCANTFTGLKDPTECSSCHSKNLKQDEDVLDTWFSSWLWPLSPLGWPSESKDLEYYLPTSTLVTGPDIIFLWVARMIMVTKYVRGVVPFKEVFFNAVICDKQGRKFSKTLGNGIDPLELIDQYGADAVRFICVSLAPLGGRVKMDPLDFDRGGRFMTKIWNCARFVLSHGTKEPLVDFSFENLDLPSKWFCHELHLAAEDIAKRIDHYQLSEATERLYDLIWKNFCDWTLESIKPKLKNELEKKEAYSFLVYSLDILLRLGSPFIPFISEEIWSKLPTHPKLARPKSLMVAAYPTKESLPAFEKEHKKWQKVQEILGSIRSLRSRLQIPFSKKQTVYLRVDESYLGLLVEASLWLKDLGACEELIFSKDQRPANKAMVSTGQGYVVYLEVANDFDLEKELKKLEQEKERISKILSGLKQKLSNEAFVKNAPSDVLVATRVQMENMEDQLVEIVLNVDGLR